MFNLRNKADGSGALVNTIDNVEAFGVLPSNMQYQYQAAPAAKTTSTTLTAAELLGGLITGNQGAAGAATYTLPTAANLAAALPADFPINGAFDFTVINISTVAAETITIATNTGLTLVGDLTIACNAVGDASQGTFRVRRTGASAFSVYRVA